MKRGGGRWHEADAEVDGVNGEEGDGEVRENGHVDGVMDGEQGMQDEQTMMVQGRLGAD